MAGLGLAFISVGLVGIAIGFGCLLSRELRHLAAYWIFVPAAAAWGAFVGFDRAPRTTLNEWHVGQVIATDPNLARAVNQMLLYAIGCALIGFACAYLINEMVRLVSPSAASLED